WTAWRRSGRPTAAGPRRTASTGAAGSPCRTCWCYAPSAGCSGMETASTVRDEIVQQALAARRARWCQTPQERIPGVEAAAPLIDRLGIVTLFPASEEVPNLFHAYMGDPHAPTSSQWDSPSGHVYTWRWTLGRRPAGFYSSLVRGRPTWVSWGLLPAVLR